MCIMDCRYLDLLESVSRESAVTAKAQIVYEKKKLEDMVQPTMLSSPELDEIVQPQARWASISHTTTCICSMLAYWHFQDKLLHQWGISSVCSAVMLMHDNRHLLLETVLCAEVL